MVVAHHRRAVGTKRGREHIAVEQGISSIGNERTEGLVVITARRASKGTRGRGTNIFVTKDIGSDAFST